MCLPIVLVALAAGLGIKALADEINNTKQENCDHFYIGSNHVCQSCGKQDPSFLEDSGA